MIGGGGGNNPHCDDSKNVWSTLICLPLRPNDYNYVSLCAGSAGNDPYDPVVRSFCDDIMGPSVFNTVQSRAQGWDEAFVNLFLSKFPCQNSCCLKPTKKDCRLPCLPQAVAKAGSNSPCPHCKNWELSTNYWQNLCRYEIPLLAEGMLNVLRPFFSIG